MKWIYGLALAALVASSPAWAETLTDRSIVALSASGIGDEAIIAKIESSAAKFDLSTEQMIALKHQGVSGPVIAAMIAASNRENGQTGSPARKPDGRDAAVNSSALKASRPAGIYLLSSGQLIRLDFNVSGQTKTGGLLGTMLTSGIAATSIKAVLQGENARVKTTERSPTFYFYLPDGVNRANASSFEAQAAGPVSPNEFSLIRLSQNKGSREARVGRANIGGVKSGIMDKDRVDFQYDEVRPGVYSVKTVKPLSQGEYSFVIIGSGGAKMARFFDFSEQP